MPEQSIDVYDCLIVTEDPTLELYSARSVETSQRTLTRGSCFMQVSVPQRAVSRTAACGWLSVDHHPSFPSFTLLDIQSFHPSTPPRCLLLSQHHCRQDHKRLG